MKEPEEALVTVFEGDGISAEMEAQAIHGLLESSGIDSMLVRDNIVAIPVGLVKIRVMAAEADRAREAIREGRQAGPEAAEAAEAETEL